MWRILSKFCKVKNLYFYSCILFCLEALFVERKFIVTKLQRSASGTGSQAHAAGPVGYLALGTGTGADETSEIAILSLSLSVKSRGGTWWTWGDNAVVANVASSVATRMMTERCVTCSTRSRVQREWLSSLRSVPLCCVSAAFPPSSPLAFVVWFFPLLAGEEVPWSSRQPRPRKRHERRGLHRVCRWLRQ